MIFILYSFTPSSTGDQQEAVRQYLKECKGKSYNYLRVGEVDSAQFWAYEGLSYFKRENINDSLLIGKQYNFLSYVEGELGYKVPALNYADSAILYLKSQHSFSKDILYSYRQKAQAYQFLGDFYQANTVLEMALYIADSLREQRIAVLNDLGTVAIHIGDQNRAESYYRMLLAEKGIKPRLKAICQANLTDLYLDQGRYFEAKEIWKEVQEYTKSNNFEEDQLLPDFLQIKAHLLQAEGELQQSIETHKIAIELLEKQAHKKPKTEKFRCELVKLLIEVDTEQALEECRKSYRYFSNQNIAQEGPFEMVSTHLMASVFYEQYRTQNQSNLLDSCLFYCSEAQKAADLLRDEFLYRNSKYVLAKYIKANAALGIDAANEQIERGKVKTGLELLFYFIEKGKSQILLDELEEKQITQLKDKGILEELYSLELQKIESKDSIKNLTLNDKIETLKKELKRNLPHKDRLNSTSKNLDKLLELSIETNTTFLEFGEGRQFIYILMIRNGELSKKQILVPKDSLQILINKHLTYLSDPRASAIDYGQVANELYTIILAPLIIQNQKIVIIPSEFIATLPFGSLVMDAPIADSYKQLTYSVAKWQFSYAFSSSFITGIEAERKQSFCGMLPVNQNEGDLSSHEELLEHLDGKFYGTYFQKEMSFDLSTLFKKHDFMHISSHGTFSEENPTQSYLFMPGSDSSKLNISQLYSIAMRRHPFVVLNACEVGKGAIKSGEGIDNFTRAFFYSGASGIIESSWKINANQTAIIFKIFYSNLLKGVNTKVALRAAQLAYLKDQNTDNHFAHPYYWSGFRHFGTAATLKKKTSNIFYGFIGGIVILVLGIVLFIRKAMG